MELQANLANLREQKLGLAAISYDSPAILKSFAERANIAFPLLSDTDSRIIQAWGILNETVPANSPAYGIPYPGTFILDSNGVVVAKYFEEDYHERYTASEILLRQFGVEPGSKQMQSETKHLRVSTSVSLTTVKWGQRIALVVDVDLKRKMHVYAPGVEGYIPIDWSIAASAAFKVHSVNYPVSRKIHLKAINETVPVYESHLRLVRDITIGTDPKVKPVLTEKGEMIVNGTFRYQACDDRTCYIPQNIPLTWTLRYEALDRQRAPTELQRKVPAR